MRTLDVVVRDKLLQRPLQIVGAEQDQWLPLGKMTPSEFPTRRRRSSIMGLPRLAQRYNCIGRRSTGMPMFAHSPMPTGFGSARERAFLPDRGDRSRRSS